jgi:hypothetical protein
LSSSPSRGTTSRFVREKFYPSSWNTGAERFCALFHRYGYIYKPLVGGTWLSADENWQLTDTEILKAAACVHQKFFIGARSGRASRFAVLDIDARSKYHSVKEVDKIRNLLAAAGISRTVPYQSSSSGGWHLYIFFDQSISSRDLNKQLTLFLQLNNFSVQKGQLEVFPNPGERAASLGLGLRVPLQPGWGWLDPKDMTLETEREQLSALEALDLFLLDMDTGSNTRHDFHRLKRYVENALARKEKVIASEPIPARSANANNVVAIRSVTTIVATESAPAICRAFGSLPPGILADVWLKGRSYYENGLSGPSQRADAIFSLGHYLFYGNPELGLPALGYGCEEERQRVIERILSTKHNGHSADIIRGRTDALQQVKRAAHWRPAARQNEEHTRYSLKVPISWVLENEKRKQDARTRITVAVQSLTAAGRAFTASDIRAKARCSWTTLYKHEDLWKSELPRAADPAAGYEQIAGDIFAISTHEYNVVEWPSCSESLGSSPVEVAPAFFVPPICPGRESERIWECRESGANSSEVLSGNLPSRVVTLQTEETKSLTQSADSAAQDLSRIRNPIKDLVLDCRASLAACSDPEIEAFGLSLHAIKSVLVVFLVLLGYFALALKQEKQNFVQVRIRQVRQLVAQAEKPLFLVRPP